MARRDIRPFTVERKGRRRADRTHYPNGYDQDNPLLFDDELPVVDVSLDALEANPQSSDRHEELEGMEGGATAVPLPQTENEADPMDKKQNLFEEQSASDSQSESVDALPNEPVAETQESESSVPAMIAATSESEIATGPSEAEWEAAAPREEDEQAAPSQEPVAATTVADEVLPAAFRDEEGDEEVGGLDEDEVVELGEEDLEVEARSSGEGTFETASSWEDELEEDEDDDDLEVASLQPKLVVVSDDYVSATNVDDSRAPSVDRANSARARRHMNRRTLEALGDSREVVRFLFKPGERWKARVSRWAR